MSGPQGEIIGDALTNVIAERSIALEDLARDVGVSYTHLINIKNGKRRASIQLVRKLAARLGVVVGRLIDLQDVSADRQPLSTHGMFDHPPGDPMPPAFVLTDPCFVFAPGDTLFYRAGEYEPGRYVLVRGVEGRCALAKAVDANGVQLLETGRGDLLLYRPGVHEILGVVTHSQREH